MKHIKLFTATWCGPCKMTKPIIEELEKELDILVEYYDVDTDRDMAIDMGIKSIPTIIYMEEGKEYARTSGYLPKKKIIEKFEVR